MHPTLKAEIFALLEAKILAGKQATGRTGTCLPAGRWICGKSLCWASCDWGWMPTGIGWRTWPTITCSCARCLGVPAAPWGENAKVFGHQTLRDNVALLDDALLQQINAAIAAAGREVFAKKGGAPVASLEVKVDSYVLESDVHFPTDLNLLWDAGRKCVDKAVP